MPNLLDRALGWVGLQRQRQRRVGATAYKGAVSNRLTEDWVFSPIKSADQEIRGSIRILKGRARDLCRNNPFATRFQALLSENVIGRKGIRLQSRVRRPDGSPDRDTRREIERAWKDWCRPVNASVDGRLSFRDIECLGIETIAQDGEALIRMVPAFGNDFGFSLQVLDPDQLDDEFNRPKGREGREVRMGVEVDDWGRAVAFHVWNHHPQDYSQRERERIRIPAEQIIQPFLSRRAGQTRGVTWYAPVIWDTKILAGYQEAELVAARTAAAKMGFFKQDPEMVDDPDEYGGSQASVSMDADPGRLETVVGLDFVPWDPQHPTTAFEAFTKQILRSISTGLRTGYASMTGDLTEVSFSSIRQGTLQERDVWQQLQEWYSTHFHERVFREWLRWALLSGQIDLPGQSPAAYMAHEWMPRGWPWVDPLKDIQASAIAIRLGLDSRTSLAAERGRDFEEILADLQEEQRLADEMGIELSTELSVSSTSKDDEGRAESTVLTLPAQRAAVAGGD